jgi:tripartite-type tricarboxylate transporter receptor subunit TctC
MRAPPAIRLCAIGVVLIAAASARAQAPEGFFKGRQITFLIGAGAGGGYDAYFRTFGRYLVRHIPGTPTIVPKNMPAASGLAAANTLYTSADRDGATIGAFPNNIPMPATIRRSSIGSAASASSKMSAPPGSRARSRPSRKRASAR